MAMHFVRFTDSAAFLDRAEAWLVLDEARHNRILGLARSAVDSPSTPAPLMAVVESADGAIAGCVLMAPGQQLDCSDMPEAAVISLAAGLLETGAKPGRIGGPPPVVAAFVAEWCRRSGARATPQVRHGIYRLDRLIEPERPGAGVVRPASPEDRSILVAWFDGFRDHTGLMLPDSRDMADRLTARGALYVLEVAGGPVCMGAVPRTTPNGAGLAFIYSPPERRGFGHATTLTAALTRDLLASGFRFCFLHTDLSYDISNRIYRRLGYELVAEMHDFTFEYPVARGA